jgi:rRNA processing protein Krr1/Pno1
MEVLAVFRGGRWIQYVPRISIMVDPRITAPLKQKAAAAYVTALQKGFQEERAHTLAEAMVFKTIYEELQYEKDLETDLQKLMGREGRA